MGRPIIGITGELEAARWRNWIREAVVSPVSYTRAVERAGGAPVILPPVPSSSVPSLIAGIDALVVAGGRDVDPALYDEAPHEQTDLPDHRRDRFEILMTRAAIDADLPFLAICRGMHILNVARGGTLIQHLPDRLGSESHKPDPVKMTIHDVQISAASKLGRALGATAQVPAAHHQAIDRIGSGLLTVAWTPDQVVEAVELQGHKFGIGVQWHPEESDDARIFEALVAAAKPASAPPPATEVAGRSKRNSKRHATRSSQLTAQLTPTAFAAFGPAASADWTAGPHGRSVPFPALAAQDTGDLSRGPAAVLGGVRPAIPEGFRSLDPVRVVPVGVAPAALGRVGGQPVELDAQVVFLVQVVQVPGSAAMPALGLPSRRRQAVRPLHAVDVVPLQRRVDAIGRVLRGTGDPGPPADPRPADECPAQRLR